jgi:Phage integrase family
LIDDVYEAVGTCLKDKSPEDALFTWSDGRPVKDFRGSWRTLTAAAKVKVRIHDFRRSAVRNMMDAGVNRDVAKKISGHKADSIFSRYNMVDASDLADAAQKLQARNRV